ncbi:cysteine proteinase inhibitor 6-like [Salvia divinorum]|uniref:Cysteine proteinase inhibitor 6-like n=1 Tax=Salvia divinorum TaxID=28513 RepID=A0ABD1GEF6_SALDI
MASSITLTASFFGGAVAAKPPTATTRRGPLAVRASMDLEKAVAESSNTRRGLMLASVATAAASVAEVAMADVANIVLPPGFKPTDPNTPEVLLTAKFAVSEYNKQEKTFLTFESVLKAEKQVFGGVIYKLVISARDERPVKSNNYQTIVFIQDSPTLVQAVSFEPLLR